MFTAPISEDSTLRSKFFNLLSCSKEQNSAPIVNSNTWQSTVPSIVIRILKALEKPNNPLTFTRLYGGAPRDIITGNQPHDFDIVTLLPTDIAQSIIQKLIEQTSYTLSRSKHIPNLIILSSSDGPAISISCRTLPELFDQFTTRESRDFTCNQLICNSRGEIFASLQIAPIQTILTDIEQRKIALTSTENPLEICLRNPVIILRIMDLYSRGYQLSPSLSDIITHNPKIWHILKALPYGERWFKLKKIALSKSGPEQLKRLVKHKCTICENTNNSANLLGKIVMLFDRENGEIFNPSELQRSVLTKCLCALTEDFIEEFIAQTTKYYAEPQALINLIQDTLETTYRKFFAWINNEETKQIIINEAKKELLITQTQKEVTASNPPTPISPPIPPSTTPSSLQPRTPSPLPEQILLDSPSIFFKPHSTQPRTIAPLETNTITDEKRPSDFIPEATLTTHTPPATAAFLSSQTVDLISAFRTQIDRLIESFRHEKARLFSILSINPNTDSIESYVQQLREIANNIQTLFHQITLECQKTVTISDRRAIEEIQENTLKTAQNIAFKLLTHLFEQNHSQIPNEILVHLAQNTITTLECSPLLRANPRRILCYKEKFYAWTRCLATTQIPIKPEETPIISTNPTTPITRTELIISAGQNYTDLKKEVAKLAIQFQSVTEKYKQTQLICVAIICGQGQIENPQEILFQIKEQLDTLIMLCKNPNATLKMRSTLKKLIHEAFNKLLDTRTLPFNFETYRSFRDCINSIMMQIDAEKSLLNYSSEEIKQKKIKFASWITEYAMRCKFSITSILDAPDNIFPVQLKALLTLIKEQHQETWENVWQELRPAIVFWEAQHLEIFPIIKISNPPLRNNVAKNLNQIQPQPSQSKAITTYLQEIIENINAGLSLKISNEALEDYLSETQKIEILYILPAISSILELKKPIHPESQTQYPYPILSGACYCLGLIHCLTKTIRPHSEIEELSSSNEKIQELQIRIVKNIVKILEIYQIRSYFIKELLIIYGEVFFNSSERQSNIAAKLYVAEKVLGVLFPNEMIPKFNPPASPVQPITDKHQPKTQVKKRACCSIM